MLVLFIPNNEILLQKDKLYKSDESELIIMVKAFPKWGASYEAAFSDFQAAKKAVDLGKIQYDDLEKVFICSRFALAPFKHVQNFTMMDLTRTRSKGYAQGEFISLSVMHTNQTLVNDICDILDNQFADDAPQALKEMEQLKFLQSKRNLFFGLMDNVVH